MNCSEYQSLSFPEQVEFVGRLVVAVQTSNKCFKAAKILLEVAEQHGVFDKIKVGHEVFEAKNYMASEVMNDAYLSS